MRHKKEPVIWFIWDAAANWVVQKLLKESALPSLEKIAKRGVWAALNPPMPNCQTPPSLATLFTGVWPWRHGVNGYSVPDTGQKAPVTLGNPGFNRNVLKAETIWRYVQNRNISTVLINIPWSIQDEAPQSNISYAFSTDSYLKRVCRGGIIFLSELLIGDSGCLEFSLGPYRFTAKFNDEILEICLQGSNKRLQLAVCSSYSLENQFFKINYEIGTSFCLWKRPEDNKFLLIHTGIWETEVAPAADAVEFIAQTGPFIGEGLGSQYRQGFFGLKLIDGGDGRAEQILINTIRWSAEYFRRAAMSAVNLHSDAGLYILYFPCIDDIEHEIIGWCDPASKAFKPDLEKALWEVLRSVYQLADRQLGEIMNRFGDDCTFLITSDHGMAGVTYTVYINEALREAGLLRYTTDGKPDLHCTYILYHLANNGSLWVNDISRPNGIVTEDYRKTVLNEAVKVLRDLKNPVNGENVIESIYPEDASVSVGWNPHIGDLFLSAADGYQLSAEVEKEGQIIVPSSKNGNHATNPKRPSMQGIFFCSGYGVTHNEDIGTADNRDVFPLVCQRLGIEPPDYMEGRIPPGIFKTSNEFSECIGCLSPFGALAGKISLKEGEL